MPIPARAGLAASAVAASLAVCDPAQALQIEGTQLVCVLSGTGDMRVPGQEQLRLYGTDLGWTYERDGKLEILFGDTWDEPAAELNGLLPDPKIPRDDAFGTIDLTAFPDGDSVESACARNGGKAPLIRYAAASPTTLATLDPGVAMDGLKTPTLSFSAGRGRGTRAFSVFVIGKPKVCVVDPDCLEFKCDTGLGFVGARPEDMGPGLTFPCVDGAAGCTSDTLPKAGRPSGVCVDRGSSIAAPADSKARVASAAWRQLVGVRMPGGAGNVYKTQDWYTNRFINVAGSTVQDFDPARAGGKGNDYRAAEGHRDTRERLLMWGRPNWVGLEGEQRKLHMYFAYVDLPKVAADGSFAWRPSYFTGLDAAGRPRFSQNQTEASPLDMTGGPDDGHDVVAQHSVRWLPQLGKWVMVYGGGAQTSDMICSSLGNDCKAIVRGKAAVRMRTAEAPWGPWSRAQDVLVGGDPYAGATAGSQYVPGGLLAHPACKAPACAPRSIPPLSASDTGAFYGANLIDQWTETRSDGSVDLYWNVSTWNPYRVVLMKTRVKP